MGGFDRRAKYPTQIPRRLGDVKITQLIPFRSRSLEHRKPIVISGDRSQVEPKFGELVQKPSKAGAGSDHHRMSQGILSDRVAKTRERDIVGYRYIASSHDKSIAR